jgi:protein tyrosine kinase modulator
VTPSQFFAALRARFGLFGIALLSTVFTATAISLIMPKVFKATAAVVVDTRQEQSLNNSLNALFSPQERAAYIQTQVDIITSEKVAHEVVNRLGLADKPDIQADFEELDTGSGTIEEWLANLLLLDLEVETSQSAVINISYAADNAQYAAAVANTFAEAYIDRVLELRVEPTRHAAAWFDEQLTTLRTNLEKAQSRLTEFQQEHGIVSTDENLDVGQTQLSELSSQVVRAREEYIDLKSRELQVEQLAERGAPLESSAEAQNDSLIRDLRRGIQDGEVRLRELATQYGVNHPQYRRQQAEIESRKERLDAEIAKLVAATEARTRQGEQREQQLQSAFDSQRQRLLEMKESRDKLTVLMRNVDSAQQAYETVMQRYLTSQVESRASKTNVAILNPAVAPRLPHSPKVMLNVALSFVVGIMLGTALIVALELSDRRVRGIEDLRYSPDVPLLGELSAWQPSERLLLAGPGSPGRNLPGPD